jgi:peptidoglycan/LPS O-acetylase OafA/YrhL
MAKPGEHHLGRVILVVTGLMAFVLMSAFGDLGVTGLAQTLLLGPPACALVAGALALEKAEVWPNVPGLQALGNASYSLYLTHGLFISFVTIVAHGAGLPNQIEIIFGFYYR